MTTTDPGRPYWVSWYQTKTLGPFELHTPWWVSGWRLDDGGDSICAAVMAADEDAADWMRWPA